MEVTEDAVFEAIQKLRAKGNAHGVRDIRKYLGDRGSHSTIQRFRERFLALEAMPAPEFSDPEIEGEAQALVRKLSGRLVEINLERERERDLILRDQLQQSDTEVQNMSEQLLQLKDIVTTRERVNGSLTQRLTDAENVNERKARDVDRLRGQIRQYENQLSEQRDRILKLEQRNEARQREIEAAKATMGLLTSKNEQLMVSNSQLSEKLNAAERRIHELELRQQLSRRSHRRRSKNYGVSDQDER